MSNSIESKSHSSFANSSTALTVALIHLILFTTFLSCPAAAYEGPDDRERAQSSQSKEFDALLNKAREGGSVRVIVRLNVDFVPEGKLSAPAKVADQQARISQAQGRLIEAFRMHAVRNIKRFKYTPHIAMEADAMALQKLISDPMVLSVQEDIPVPPMLNDSINIIGADSAWNSGYTGAGWAVAILDTGVDNTHVFLSGKIVSEACSSSNSELHDATTVCPNGETSQTGTGSGINCSAAIEGCGHGTHVAGIVAGKSETVNGVAKDADIIAIQVFSKFDNEDICGGFEYTPCALSYTSDQIWALERVYELRSTHDIASVNMSLGGGRKYYYCDDDSRKDIIDTLRSAGIVTVIASGNNGYSDSISAPACISTAVSVGSTTKLDQVAETYSNSASFLSLLALGSAINSSIPGNGWDFWNGTSMAAPHVAGAWAILKQKDSDAAVSDVLEVLQATGTWLLDTRNGIIKPRIDIGAALISELQQLTVTKAGAGAGSVTPDTGEITWTGDTGTALYIAGTEVTLTAAAQLGAEFEGWSGEGCAGTGTCTVNMSAARDVTATFGTASGLYAEDFSDIGTLDGWIMRNNSYPLGVSNWFQGNENIFSAQEGNSNSYIAANYSNAAGVGTISNWLITPELQFGSGVEVRFWTRAAHQSNQAYPDRLEVRLSSSGSSANVGSAATDVGNFDTLLLIINPVLNSTGYPQIWTEYILTSASGLPFSGSGRIAFRYFVTEGGPDGSYGDYIGIDSVKIIHQMETPTVLRISAGPTVTEYTSIQEAYNEAVDEDIIQVMEMTFTEDLFFDSDNITVLLRGGFDPGFENITGLSTV